VPFAQLGGVADGRTAGMQQAACMPLVRLKPRPAERKAGRMHGMVSVPLQPGHATWACDLGMQPGHATRACNLGMPRGLLHSSA